MNYKLILISLVAFLLINCTTDTNLSPEVTTTLASQITVKSAISGGKIITDGGSRILEQGICWDTITNPIIAKNKIVDSSWKNVFLDTISGLKANKKYYIRAFATNSTGTSYGKNEIFTTLKTTIPTLNTTEITLIAETSVASGGNVTDDGGSEVTARGVCWSTIPGATVTLSTKTTDGSGVGSFNSSITGLAGATTYYVRAYATNTQGTSYGEEIFFTTIPKAIVLNVPVLFTNVVTSITYTTATTGGSITTDGGGAIIARGVCWSTSASPTVASGFITTDGTGNGAFTSSIAGLLPGTIYHVRGYATNNQGTGYGQEQIFTTSQYAVPELISNVVTLIGYTTATGGGSITTDGGSPITVRGVCWSTSSSPTVALSTITTDGSGTGSFTSSITGLLPGTTYHIRGYATNSQGTGYGQEQTFTTTQTSAPSLSTTSVVFIGTTTAQSGGNITTDGGAMITARGICWSTVAAPTIALSTKTSDGTGTGSFTSNLTGLTASTLYHVRGYATNAMGTTYGNEVTFTSSAVVTTPTVPVLFTNAITSITSSTAVSGGNITSDGGSTITARGVCWSTSSGPTTSLSTKTSDGTGPGSFTSNLSGLTASTTYYVRSYAINTTGTAYGSEVSFKTTALATIPTLTTTAISSINITIAVSGGNISTDGGSVVTTRGVCWSTVPGATVSLSTKTSDGSGIGSFVSNISGLKASTTYYVRSYATNAVGTAYGTEIFFTTSAAATVPTLTTTAISAIATAAATSGGNVSADGGSAVIAKGVCWSTSSGATVALSTKTSNGTGTGSFVSNITGLAASTTYYVRAYATNTIGTGYGSEFSFTTTGVAAIPTLTTAAISNITTSTATSGGSVSADGGSTVTARGVCWSTSSGATTALATKTSDGAGTGSFTSSITGLTGSTLYYVRGYATNTVGTAYGNEVTFTTSAGMANSTGTLSVSVLTVAPGGSYKPKNVVSIWIETNAGVFVKSLLVYANARKSDLTTWYSNSGGNVVNATTGATQSSNATRTCTWNGTDVNGAVVVDGTYKVCMNIADGKTAFSSFAFTKGTAAVTLTPANVTGFSSISISWIH